MIVNGPLQRVRKTVREQWGQASTYKRIIIGIAIFYLIAVGGYLILHNTFFLPDEFFVVALIAAILLGRVKAFLWDWVPLILLLLGYEYVRGLVPLLENPVHIRPMIEFDQYLFGNIPTIILQDHFYRPGVTRWYDVAAVICYLAHFIVPLTVAFIFWVKDRPFFKEYAAGMVVLSYITYLTYLVFPAAPPWMAYQMGFLPKVYKVMDEAFASFQKPIHLPTVYRYIGANLVAAVPSLHAAYPVLTGIFVGRKVPKLIPLAILYMVSVWVAVVYLGEHYVFDIIVGVLYAVVTYGLVRAFPKVKAKVWKRKARERDSAATPSA